MRLLTHIGVIAAFCGIAAAQVPTTRISDDEAAGNTALAGRLCQLAQITLNARDIVPQTLHESIALLKVASRLDPTEPSYPRLLIEAYLLLGGAEGRAGAIEASNTYLRLVPDDICAKVRLIDMHFSQIEAADQRSKYIDQLLNTPSLAPELESHVAVLGAKLAMDRAEDSKATEYIERALKLFPLSPEALDLKHDQMPDDAPAPQRVALLVQMLQSNPAQGDVMRELGDIAASAGLLDTAMYWYSAKVGMARAVGEEPSPDVLTALAEEFAIADQGGAARNLAHSLLEKDASNSEAAFLELILEKRLGTPDRVTAATEVTRTALTMRLGRISDTLNSRESTTQPSINLDIPADLAKLQQVQNPTLSAAYASGLCDLAWLNIYFLNKPSDAAPYMTALRQLLSADSVTLARLDGWTFLVQGQKDEARVKLSAVAGIDPFSQLGMLRLDDGQVPADKLLASARKLVSENASGLTGAVLMDALRERVGILPPGPGADEVRAALDKFPKEFLDLVDSSKSKNFYMVKAEPLKVGHAFGEPMFVKITIANVGNYPLTVGPDGALHNDLWIDVRLAGVVQKSIPGAAFDRFGKTLLLRPRDSVSQVVRIDQGPLTDALQSNPQVAMPLYGSVVINPIPMMQSGGVVPGPNGCRSNFTRIMQRDPSPQDVTFMQKVLDRLQNGRADVRFRTVELLTAFATAMLSMKNDDAVSRGMDLADIVHKSIGDRVTAVRSHAMFATSILSKLPVRLAIFKQMLDDPQYLVRAEALAALSSSADPQTIKEMSRPLAESDPDPLIQDLAKAVIEVADLPPPATQPSGEAGLDRARIPMPTTAPSLLQPPLPSSPASPLLPPVQSPLPTPDQVPVPGGKPADSPAGGAGFHL